MHGLKTIHACMHLPRRDLFFFGTVAAGCCNKCDGSSTAAFRSPVDSESTSISRPEHIHADKCKSSLLGTLTLQQRGQNT
ncbi:predicted protein [Plenodomus lingam JN3]|uniref:Predicted protein n=1 Tax=Leptosphaeria maculans (strain JN3 / isolate v23.1.3 / race Av1-4-5-6-7-8) TaxID=985895 RepID=E5R491_LEPMJ|nr:predicted protein [Plenodomus lingam JN3]CBX91859.1 predicted protein [Plenodomus lingam JN3]